MQEKKSYVFYKESYLYQDFTVHLGQMVNVRLKNGKRFRGVLVGIDEDFDFETEEYSAYVTIGNNYLNISDIVYYEWNYN